MSLFPNNEERKKRLEKARQEREEIVFLRDMLLESDAPDYVKTDITIMKVADDIIDKITSVKTIVLTDSEEIKEKQIALEYLTCVLGGVEMFIQQHPIIASGQAFLDSME